MKNKTIVIPLDNCTLTETNEPLGIMEKQSDQYADSNVKSWCDVAVNYLSQQDSIDHVVSIWGDEVGVSGALNREQILQLASLIKEGKQ